MINKKKFRNIGILAHVDAGKTTVTEHFLYKSGSIRQLGRVDAGTAHTDSLDIERNRGISVRSAAATFCWKGNQINLIDTPGHVDFYAEVERALRALDGAILVLSAVEGVEAQTEIIWSALRAMQIPTLLFVNKIDRLGASCKRVLQEIQERLSPKAIPLQQVTEPGTKNFSLHPLDLENSQSLHALGRFIEEDWDLLERYVQEKNISSNMITEKMRQCSQQGHFFPVLFGSALKGVGIEELLDAITTYLPTANGSTVNPPAGVIFKIEHDNKLGKLCHVRLYQGQFSTRELVMNSTRENEEKITQILQIDDQFKKVTIPQLTAGDIGILRGLVNAQVGDILGDATSIPSLHSKTTPLLQARVYPKNSEELYTLFDSLKVLEEEDPLLNIQWLEEEKEIIISFMGHIQLEILSSTLQSRFDLQVIFDQPTVIYKETPRTVDQGSAAYTSPVWGALKLQIEPLPRGSGQVYVSALSTDYVSPKYQREVEMTVPTVLKEGLLGWEVTDIKVTLIDGVSDKLASSSSDFRTLTPMVLMEALDQAQTDLLEPLLEFELKISRELFGKVVSDLIQMRADFNNPIMQGTEVILRGTIPVATSMDYPIKIASLSQGRGRYITRFHGYQKCPLELGKTRKRKTVDPLNRAKFFLSVQKVIGR